MAEPWVRFEDDQVLAVTKPAGINTHRADTHAQDGMYEWVQRQRPDVSLSILHRLDKATSGLLIFGKTTAANRSLAEQFEHRTVDKRYELLVRVDRGRRDRLRCDQPINGEAVTEFTRQADSKEPRPASRIAGPGGSPGSRLSCSTRSTSHAGWRPPPPLPLP